MCNSFKVCDDVILDYMNGKWDELLNYYMVKMVNAEQQRLLLFQMEKRLHWRGLLTNSIPLNTHCTVQQIIMNKQIEFYGIIINEKKNDLSKIWKKLIFIET